MQWPGTQLGFPSGKLAGKAKLSDLETEAPRDQLLVLGNSEGLELKVQFSPSVVSDSLRPHELHHARPPCPSPSPRVHSNSHSLCW